MSISTIKQQWFGNIKNDILSGMVVAMALIPEAIAFSIIAGVDPMVGLYASFCIAVIISFTGGRIGMVSAATGSTALLMVTLVADHGLKYLLATTILTGILQILFGVFGIARYLKFVPRSVMTGFVNALAILIFMAQLVQFRGAAWPMYAMVAGTLGIIYLLPRITKAVPASLIAIVIMTVITVLTGVNLKTVGDMGELTQALPMFMLPDIPINFHTLGIIFPYALAISIVGLLESFLTAQVIDDATDTPSNKNKEARGQGIANIVSGFFGGMAGCAMIGQSVINIKSGGRGRLSTFVAGVFLMVLILVLNNVLNMIPMAALVGVMFMVSISTFDWASLKTLHKLPKTDAVVMIVTVITVVLTNNLSIGVLVGILLSAIFFVYKISDVNISKAIDEVHQKKIYTVRGQLFFASTTHFISEFDFNEDVDAVEIDMTHTHVWDDSAVAAIDKVILKFRENGKKVTVDGFNDESHAIMGNLSEHHKPEKIAE